MHDEETRRAISIINALIKEYSTLEDSEKREAVKVIYMYIREVAPHIPDLAG